MEAVKSTKRASLGFLDTYTHTWYSYTYIYTHIKLQYLVLFEQETKVEKLKSSLDDAMSAHKKAMDDNEKLLNDLKKANSTIRVSPLILVHAQYFS